MPQKKKPTTTTTTFIFVFFSNVSFLMFLLFEYNFFCRFFVDDIPIRRYLKKNDATFPQRPMYVYGSIWDASSWATEEGRIKADYRYQPFVGKYSNNFKLEGCEANESPSCRRAPSSSPSGGGGLSRQQIEAMLWVQRNYKVYDYCRDPRRDHTHTPEC